MDGAMPPIMPPQVDITIKKCYSPTIFRRLKEVLNGRGCTDISPALRLHLFHGLAHSVTFQLPLSDGTPQPWSAVFLKPGGICIRRARQTARLTTRRARDLSADSPAIGQYRADCMKLLRLYRTSSRKPSLNRV